MCSLIPAKGISPNTWRGKKILTFVEKKKKKKKSIQLDYKSKLVLVFILAMKASQQSPDDRTVSILDIWVSAGTFMFQ